MSRPVVVKYGGSVLKDADAFRRAAGYAVRKNAVVLTSAMHGITNRFLDMYPKRAIRAQQELADVIDVYWDIVKPLRRELHDQAMEELKEEVGRAFIYWDTGVRDAFIGSPEGHSAIMLKYHIKALGKNAEHLTGPDAGFILNDHGIVDVAMSRKRLLATAKTLLKLGNMCVFGGFLGRHYRTNEYKLGARNINDAFAAALADALNAEHLEIVKDISGIYRIPPDFGYNDILERLSYDEAAKMSWRGSPVVHPSAILTAENKNIPIVVKDFSSNGTKISADSQTAHELFVAALVPERTFMVTVLDPVMATPEGRGYRALIEAFEMKEGNDTGIMASDRGSISYTMPVGNKKRVADNSRLFADHNARLQDYLHSHGYRPRVEGEEVGQITIVGDGMQKRTGTVSFLSAILGNRGISLRAATQSDEKYSPPSITFVVDSDKLEPSVKALAEELFAA